MNVKIGNIGQRYIDKIRNNKEVAMSAVSGNVNQISNIEQKNQLPAKLRSRKFRQMVRVVLDDFGVEMTVGNFRKYDKIYDLKECYDRLENPRFDARVFLLSNNPNIAPVGRILDEGSLILFRVELFGNTREEALRNINSKAYEFIEWC